MVKDFKKILSHEKTTKYLKMGKSTLYKMVSDGKIPPVKIDMEETARV